MTWEPEACTLPTIDRPLRHAEFDALFTRLTSLERLSPGRVRLHLAGPAGLDGTVRDLTARETECCSLFTFTTVTGPGGVILDAEVPPAHTAVLEALAARAEAVAAQAGAS
jgi:hypothetical protein